jgi:TonB-linked SusC/RagA family outer membrane protein
MSLTFFNTTLMFLMLVCTSAYAQKLDGRVMNMAGKPVDGATIEIAGSSNKSVSDRDGRFSISLPLSSAPYLLRISSAGHMRKEVSVQNVRDSLEIILQEDYLKLDAVVLTGNVYNTTKRKLGNSISTIEGDETKYTSSGHISTVFNGRVMGGVVTQNSGDPGGGFSLKLRGVGSVFGSSEPLYILDGVVIDNGSQNLVNLNQNPNLRFQTGSNRLIDINPHDIDRIEVINGPSAAAIYGSRASNGVVQLFTKKGRTGKPTVSFSSAVNHNSLARRIEVNEFPYRFGRNNTGLEPTRAIDRRTTVSNFRPDQNVNPGAGPRAVSGNLDTTRYPVKRYDYQDQLFNSSWGTDQYLSVSGGSDRSKYFFSGSYLDNNGILKNTGFRRYGLNISLSSDLTKWMTLSGSIKYSNSNSGEMPNSFQQFSPLGAMNHTDNVFDITQRQANGDLKAVEYSWVNPLSAIETFELTTETKRTISNLQFNLKPFKGFTVRAMVGLDSYGQEGFAYQARYPYPDIPLSQFSDGYVSASKLNYEQWSTDLHAAYQTDINSRISSETAIGYSGQYFKNNFQSQEGRDLLPVIRTLAAAQNLFTLPVDNRSEQNVYGIYIQETLGYDDLLHLTLGLRTDRSSAFAASAGNLLYPKAGLSFSLSSVKWWKNNKISSWFNTAHLRVAYGKAGNLTGIGPYDRFSNMGIVNYYGQGGFATLNRRGNPDIKPEVKTEWEAGADLQFLNGRLFTQFNVYKQEIDDIVVTYNLPPSSGYFSTLDNLGAMENKGFEIMIGGTPVKSKNFSWETSALVNVNRNEVTRLYQNTSFVALDNFNTQGALIGHPISSYYGTYFARNDDGSLLLSNNNGYLLPQVERGDLTTQKPLRANGQPSGSPLNIVLGDPNPDYTLAWINTLKYRNWSFRLQIDRFAGFEVFNWTDIIRNNIGNGKLAEQELKGELARGWAAAVGGQINGPFISEAAVEDGSFTRIREASLSYNWNSLKQLGNLEFILSGRNLFNFTSYNGFDPENSTAGQSIVRGIDYFTVPTPRVIQFSVIATFR